MKVLEGLRMLIKWMFKFSCISENDYFKCVLATLKSRVYNYKISMEPVRKNYNNNADL